VRSYAKSPGLTVTIVVTLALGVGASLASFSLVNAMLVRPIGGVVRPAELVRIAASDDQNYLLPLTSAMREPLEQLPAFAGVCGVNTPGAVVTVGDRVARVGALQFSGDCFDVLGVKPRLGRLLTAADDRSATPVAVVTYEFWQRALGEMPDVLGSTIEIDGAPFTIVGVAEPAFRGLSNAFPHRLPSPSTRSVGLAGRTGLEVIARRAPHVSLEQARAQVDSAWPRLKAAANVSARTSASMRRRFDARRAFVGDIHRHRERRAADVPAAAAPDLGPSMLMLAICTANVANLLVARALTRRREHAMRSSSAPAADLWWQTAMEALIPVAGGTLLAVPLAF
jgi:hypothetical protein